MTIKISEVLQPSEIRKKVSLSWLFLFFMPLVYTIALLWRCRTPFPRSTDDHQWFIGWQRLTICCWSLSSTKRSMRACRPCLSMVFCIQWPVPSLNVIEDLTDKSLWISDSIISSVFLIALLWEAWKWGLRFSNDRYVTPAGLWQKSTYSLDFPQMPIISLEGIVSMATQAGLQSRHFFS